MIGVIPNPKKNFQVEKPMAEVRQAIGHLTLFTSHYKLYKANPTLNQFTFEATEFLSVGVYIDINCYALTDNRTDVSIEIRRKIGSFDQSYEIEKANTHISTLTDLIAKSIDTDPELRIAKAQVIEAEKRNKEEAQKQKLADQHQKAEEQKRNNPVSYYTRMTLAFIVVFGVLGWVIYMLFKVVSK